MDASRPVASFEFRPEGPYSLGSSTAFLERFEPAAYEGAGDGHLHLAFVVDGTERAVGVCVRDDIGNGTRILADVYGNGDGLHDAVYAQVARVLSLDVDGTGFHAVGGRDPVISDLQRSYPGLRPVGFFSPYEAAAWALIGNRIRIVQAARVKARMAERLGHMVNIYGDHRYVFPSPSGLTALDAFPGLSERKVTYLRHLGGAARDGKLDPFDLRSRPMAEALDHLKTLRGIGDFSADLILLRGACIPDGLPRFESRLARAVALVYGLDEPPDQAAMERIADPWRPYRTWVSVLLRTHLESRTNEIATGRRAT